VHNYAVPVVGEFPVRRLLGLWVGHGLQADEVVIRVAARPGRRLLLPVGQRIRLRLIELVDQQENAAVRRIADVSLDSRSDN
jgi:hypothetical protein